MIGQWALCGITKAPLGGGAAGPSPVDRGKQGTKRSGWTGQRGIPLAVQITGANTPDKTGALATLDSLVVERPKNVVYRRHPWCLDRGYEYAEVLEGVTQRDYHIHGAKGEADKDSRRTQSSSRPGDGSSNEPMRGIIDADGCGADGRKREPITKHSFNWLRY